MMNVFSERGALPYRNKIYLRIFYCIAIVIAGAAAYLAVAAMPNGITAHMDDYTRGFYTGGGAGIFLAGAIKIIRYVRILMDPEKMRRMQIRENDERNLYIGQKTWSYSGYIFYGVLYIGMLVSGFLNKTVFITLTVTLGVLAGIMLIVRMSLKRKF